MIRSIRLTLSIAASILLLCATAHGQPRVRLGEQYFVPEQNMQQSRGTKPLQLPTAVEGKRNILVQLEAIPDARQRAALQAHGLELQDYLGGNAYWALLDEKVVARNQLRGLGLRSVMAIQQDWKLADALARGEVPDHARVGINAVKATVYYAKNASEESVSRALKAISGVRIEHVWRQLRYASFTAPLEAIRAVAALPYVLSISPASPPLALDNLEGKRLSRAAVLATSPALGGRGLEGQDMRIGIWDGNIADHVDFQNRVHRLEYEVADGEEKHGTHVAGTVVGAGLLDPDARGIAPKARLYS